MWGPYSIQPYSRPLVRTFTFTQALAAVYAYAAGLSSAAIAVLTLRGAYRVRGYRLRRSPRKLLGAAVICSGKLAGAISKVLKGLYSVTSDIDLMKVLNMVLAAAYTMAGTFKKRMYKNLLAAVVWGCSRLKLQYVYGWEYSGDFAPGDRIIVNRERLTVTLNGNNALHLFSGNMPFFEPGENTLTYSDDEGARTVRVRVSWRGRWL